MRIVSEAEFRQRLLHLLCSRAEDFTLVDYVTGPGRSGALAAVYVSHMLGIPFVPYGRPHEKLQRVMMVDTARESGATMRKAMRRYEAHSPVELVVYEEPPRVAFWYEALKPQRYRHEVAA